MPVNVKAIVRFTTECVVQFACIVGVLYLLKVPSDIGVLRALAVGALLCVFVHIEKRQWSRGLNAWVAPRRDSTADPDALSALRKELDVTDELLADRQRVLDAIPECPAHGPCVPHALEWIERAKVAMKANGG